VKNDLAQTDIDSLTRSACGGTRMIRIIRRTGMCRGGLYTRLTRFFPLLCGTKVFFFASDSVE
jgi:hypothetical protein